MSGVMNAMKVFFGFQEDEMETEAVQEDMKIIPQPKQTVAAQPVIRSFKGSLVTGNASQKLTTSEIKIEEPRIYEDSLNIATYLRDNKPVIVNLKNLDAGTGKRLIDFVCGTAYAINGHMMKIGDNIFLFTPEQMAITDSQEAAAGSLGTPEDPTRLYLRDTV